MQAFVTGPSGFLGIQLLQELAGAGWEITAFHRPSSDLTDLRRLPGIRYAVGDVRDREALCRGMPEGVDAVFHTAGSVGFLKPGAEEAQLATNRDGARNVAEVALEKGARRFIETSTVLTYDYSGGRRVTEEAPPNRDPRYPYIHSKYLAELEVEKAIRKGLDAVFLHPSAAFGAYDRATWSKVFREIQRGLRIPAAPPLRASFCHMRMVARAHVAAFHKGRRGEHYILGGPDTTMLEIATEIARLLGRRPPRLVLPGFLFKLCGRLEYRLSTLLGKEPMVTPDLAEMLCDTVLCDSGKAIRELGYEPSSLQAMLADCHRWMVEAGLLPAPGRPTPELACAGGR